MFHFVVFCSNSVDIKLQLNAKEKSVGGYNGKEMFKEMQLQVCLLTAPHTGCTNIKRSVAVVLMNPV